MYKTKELEELVALYDIEGRKAAKAKIEGFMQILKEANERVEAEKKMLSTIISEYCWHYGKNS